MKQTIDIVRGTSAKLLISVADANGSAYELSDGEVLRFAVKRHPEDTECVIEKMLSNANYQDGNYVLLLSPDDTENLEVGRYSYDCGLQVGAEYYTIIERSQFNICYNISSRFIS